MQCACGATLVLGACASTSNACVGVASNGMSLVARRADGTLALPLLAAFSATFLIVLRDRLVSRQISLIDFRRANACRESCLVMPW